MAKRLSDYCDVAWDAVLDSACLDVATTANKIMSSPPLMAEDMIDVFRLPRSVLVEATAFTEQHAAACLWSRKRFPTIPIDDPWNARRMATLQARIRECIARVALLAKQKWPMSGQQVAVSRSTAQSQLIGELTARWEDGQRDYHKALQKCDAAQSRSPAASTTSSRELSDTKGGRHQGGTTEERLRKLMASEGGWEKIRACRTASQVGKLIKRCHSSVVGTKAWKQKIYPELIAQKIVAKAARWEQEERRRDRHY
jgi:hypothetical protein